MNKIAEELNRYPQDYWDFKGTTKSGIHNIGKYPATMVPDMQYQLLSVVSKHLNNKNITLLDPFCGSGTTLVIAQELGINSVGIDINPYATLLSFVKTNKYDKADVYNAISTIKSNLEQGLNFPIFDFYNIKKWFRDDIIKSLSQIRHCILLEKSQDIRKFFWICLSEVIFKFSNDRTSTFKLHALPKQKINLIEDKCIEYFIKIIKDNSEHLNYSNTTSSNIIYGDSSSIINNKLKREFDIICTSPPYGDNPTTITYGQASILFLKWIDSKDLSCSQELLEKYTTIDKISVGGKKRKIINTKDIKSLQDFLGKISLKKQAKVINFFEDYYVSLKCMNKCLAKSGYLIMTVGNRSVDAVRQPLDNITIEILESFGLKLVSKFNRNILYKNSPLKLSLLKDKKTIKTIQKETIIIFTK
ncbi:class I SAM-dependent methyltransferase (plasmid) [Lactobacillus iners]|uniref:class I SAM-dependent methyltransferase n=1 Tax=Lactobacillus iners TaxID=147802 RepID=UPI0013E14D10|nr:class I SAM-dependent methyltransferase [Lactobacillus iners]QIH25850.1 class I SAM-dependent methyltransferase [Lactobacillus iners]